MDPSHNTFAILGQLSPNSTSNPNTLPFLNQINTNTNIASPSTVITPTPVIPNNQSAFTHYNASTSAYKRTKKYYSNLCPKHASTTTLSRHSCLRHSVFRKRIGTELKQMRGMLMQAICRLKNLDDDVYNLDHKVELLEQHSEHQFELLKKLKFDDDMVVPNLGNRCDSVFGRNDGMEEGEAAVEQQ